MLHSLFSMIWAKEKAAVEWKEGFVINLPKKEDPRDCSNYTSIMLLSIPGKILCRILLERIMETIDTKLRDQPAGFCRADLVVHRLLACPLYFILIDYEKTFSCVNMGTMWKLLRYYESFGRSLSSSEVLAKT